MKVAVWCDGCWCEADEVSEYIVSTGLSDDYAIVTVPESVEDEEELESFIGVIAVGLV